MFCEANLPGTVTGPDSLPLILKNTSIQELGLTFELNT